METKSIPALTSLGLAYTVNPDGKSCTITGIGTCEDKEVGLPSILDGYTVTAIASKAFKSCQNIKSITIPPTVTEIGELAFYNATNLTTLYYNSSSANHSNNSFMVYSFISKVVFGGASVPSNLCYGMTNLVSVEILDNVTSIDYGAFSGCTNLESIVIPESVMSIGGDAFHHCRKLTRCCASSLTDR